MVIALVGGLAFIRIAQSAVKATKEFADQQDLLHRRGYLIDELEEQLENIKIDRGKQEDEKGEADEKN